MNRNVSEYDGLDNPIVAIKDYEKEGDYGKGTKFALIDYHIMGSYYHKCLYVLRAYKGREQRRISRDRC